jgi:hypothetical protein
MGVSAQFTMMTDNQIYGLDPLLYNGRLYSYFVPASTKGTPFIMGPEYNTGSVTIRGITYNDLLLNYDIYNQQLILQFKALAGNEQLLVISEAWLEAFTLGDKHFEFLPIEDSTNQLSQVLGDGKIRVLYTWKKNLSLDNSYGATNYIFSKPLREFYLVTDSDLEKYKNNRSFTALFDPVNQSLVKKYLRQQKIKMKKANDREIIKLLNYCNTLQSP